MNRRCPAKKLWNMISPGGEQASVRARSVPLLGAVRGGFTIAMRGKKAKEALHEPPKAIGQICVAYATWNCPIGFMVPMDAQNERRLCMNPPSLRDTAPGENVGTLSWSDSPREGARPTSCRPGPLTRRLRHSRG